jgi:GTP-binding protein HflX
MEEAVAADVVLHVIDASHPQYEEQQVVGEDVLQELQIPRERVIEVYNKIDRVIPSREVAPLGMTARVSALTGRGVDQLVDMIRQRELAGGAIMQLEIPHDQSRALARLHQLADVQEQRAGDRVTRVTAWLPENLVHEFEEFLSADLAKRVKVS